MKTKSLAIIGREQERCETLLRQLSRIFPELEVRAVPMIQTSAVPFEVPKTSPQIAPVYLFSSPRAVIHFFERATLPDGANVVSIGRGTSRELYKHDVHPGFISSVENAIGMAPEMLAYLKSVIGRSEIIQPTSDIAGDFLQDYFKARGVRYHKLVTYTVAPHDGLPNFVSQLTESPKFVVFYSPSGVRAWAKSSHYRPTAISIGPATTQELINEGWKEIHESRTPDGEDLLAAVTKNIQNNTSNS